MNDLISRKAALSLAKELCVPTADGTAYKHRCIDPDEIRELPSAQPERKMGKWVQSSLDNDFLTCSNCQTEKLKMRMAYRKDYAKLFLYCPWCGAEMTGGEQNG